MTEGNPIDAFYFGMLILAGLGVIARRRVVIAAIAKHNGWLVIFFLYSFLAILWSDFPIIAFKRWIKTLGHPIMALIILTDPDPSDALRRVMKRCAYILLPFSVLLIKYFPQYGRGFDEYGRAWNVGVHVSKNGLGYLCWVFGLFFTWNLLARRQIGNTRDRIRDSALSAFFLVVIAWLLKVANSATSLAVIFVGIFPMILVYLRVVSARHIGIFAILSITTLLGAEMTMGLYGEIIQVLDRDPTLTDRTRLWQDALALQENPILGAGFESFWLGPRIQALWAKWWWGPNQAHNGYIEVYLNLGILGLLLLFGVIVSTFRKITRQLWVDFDFACFRLGCFFAVLTFNIAEATFKGVALVWTLFYIIALDYPRRSQIPQESSSPRKSSEVAIPRKSAPHSRFKVTR